MNHIKGTFRVDTYAYLMHITVNESGSAATIRKFKNFG